MAAKQPTNTTQTSKVEIPEFVKPSLEKIVKEAGSLYDSGPKEYYPGQTYAGMDPYTQLGINSQANYALNSTPGFTNAAGGMSYGLLGPSIQNLRDTAGGAYLGPNPYSLGAFNYAADAVSNQFKNAIAPGIDSQFVRAGSFDPNSAGYQQTVSDSRDNLGRTLNGLANNFFFNNYSNERQLQQNASNNAGLLANNLLNTGSAVDRSNQLFNTTNLGLLQTAGAANQAERQNVINDQVQRFNFEQNAPYQALTDYLSYISGTNPGRNTTTTTQQNMYTNPFSQMLGVGLLASTLFPGAGALAGVGSAMNSGASGVWGGLLG